MDELLKEVQKMRDIECKFQEKCKCGDNINVDLYLYLEGRISAFSDIICAIILSLQKRECE